jgi:hypothetical protein
VASVTEGWSAKKGDIDRLMAQQRKNAERIQRFVMATDRAPDSTGILLNEIVNAIFEKGSKAHVFMLMVENRIAVDHLEKESAKPKLVLPGR